MSTSRGAKEEAGLYLTTGQREIVQVLCGTKMECVGRLREWRHTQLTLGVEEWERKLKASHKEGPESECTIVWSR